MSPLASRTCLTLVSVNSNGVRERNWSMSAVKNNVLIASRDTAMTWPGRSLVATYMKFLSLVVRPTLSSQASSFGALAFMVRTMRGLLTPLSCSDGTFSSSFLAADFTSLRMFVKRALSTRILSPKVQPAAVWMNCSFCFLSPSLISMVMESMAASGTDFKVGMISVSSSGVLL